MDLKQINLNHTGFINNVPNLKSATKVWGSDYNASKLKALLKHKNGNAGPQYLGYLKMLLVFIYII